MGGQSLLVRSFGLEVRSPSHDWHVQPVVKDRSAIRLSGAFQSVTPCIHINAYTEGRVLENLSNLPRTMIACQAGKTLTILAGETLGGMTGDSMFCSTPSLSARRSKTARPSLGDACTSCVSTERVLRLLKNFSEVFAIYAKPFEDHRPRITGSVAGTNFQRLVFGCWILPEDSNLLPAPTTLSQFALTVITLLS
jgi:hypothetical protein